ncbi:50S ribosomal protein L2 [Candidatus Pacearchaeota archaeon]|nr:50S ribosomal protein L2 [Candidatus Pacearchaeota archaeon]
MGKRLTQQARGKGGPAFRVRKQAYKYKITYPSLKSSGKSIILKLLNSRAHTTPLAKIRTGEDEYYVPAANGVYEGQEIEINGKIENGNIACLKDIPVGTKVYNLEKFPGSGGKILRTSGTHGILKSNDKRGVEILIRRRKIYLNEGCRAIIGVPAGDGRLIKPIVKAGKRHHMMKSVGRKWHRTSAVKVNAVDHPFGGGRGKRIKSKIAKRNAPPGRKAGHIRPKRTGKKR